MKLLEQGHVTTRGRLSNRLGTKIGIREVGPLRRDGRRELDSAGNGGPSMGTISSMLKTSIKAQQEQPLTDRQIKKLVSILPDNLCTTDCEVDNNLLPWLATYNRLLELEEHYEREL